MIIEAALILLKLAAWLAGVWALLEAALLMRAARDWLARPEAKGGEE
jgi:hypothetical protein